MHPSLRILGFLLLAAATQFAHTANLLVLGGGLVLSALVVCGKPFLRMLQRSRWLMLFLVLIYAFTTPGEYLHEFTSEFAPTYEGLAAGMLQAERLIIMLAGLALLLCTTSSEGLMSGIYGLLRPLRFLGLAPDRFSARLWLTIRYVEQAPARRNRWHWSMFDDLIFSPDTSHSLSLHLAVPEYTWRDALAIVLGCMALAWMAA